MAGNSSLAGQEFKLKGIPVNTGQTSTAATSIENPIMSSLAATQADGYYLPPEYYDSGKYKKVSKNKFAGSKGHNQFVVNGVLRFALPYKGVCKGCGLSIGSGTRYNAKKLKTDQDYLGIPIWEFVMKCRTAGCEEQFHIRTNPQEEDYDYVQGITLQHGQVQQKLPEYGTSNVIESKAPLERLESAAHGKRVTMTDHDQLKTLHKLNEQSTKHDADCNAAIRSRFRKDRKSKKSRQEQATKRGWRPGMELLAPSPAESRLAKTVTYGKTSKQQEKERWSTVRKSSIFAATPSSLSHHTKRRRFDERCYEESSSAAPDETSSSQPIPTTNTVNPTDTSATVRPDTSLSNNESTVAAVCGQSESSVPRPMVCLPKKMQFYTLTQRKRKSDSCTDNSNTMTPTKQTSSLQAMLSGYGSDSDSD